MTALLQLYPGDPYTAWAVSVLLQATAVLAIAWVRAALFAGRNAAARYATWLVALGLLLLSPLTGQRKGGTEGPRRRRFWRTL